MGLFSSDESKESKALRADAKANMEKAVAELEAIGIPSIEAQKIVLESPELVGLEEHKDLGPSDMQGLFADQGLKGAQLEMMDALGERAESGATASEKAERRDLLGSIAGQENARQAGIMREMAERGQGGGGAELAAMLQSSQSSANRGADQASDLAAQMENRALSALSQKAGLAGDLRSQDMSDKQNRASAKDRIAEMNLRASQDVNRRNLGSRQRVSDIGTQTGNQQQMHNKGLIQQDFQNRMSKAGGISGAYTNTANSLNQQAAAMPKETSVLQDIGSVASAVGGIGKTVSGMKDGGVVPSTGEKDKKPATKLQGMFAKNELEGRQNALNGEGPTETHKQYEDRVIKADMTRRYNTPQHAEDGAIMDATNTIEANPMTDFVDANRKKEITNPYADLLNKSAMDKIVNKPAEQIVAEVPQTDNTGSSEVLGNLPQDSVLDKLSPGIDALAGLAPEAQATPAPVFNPIAGPELNIPQGNLAAEAALGMAPQYADGGIPRYMDGGVDQVESAGTGELVPGEEYAGDRVDAKVNSGEMMLNIGMQQKLLDALRGDIPMDEAVNSDENIVENKAEASEEELARFAKMIGLD